MSITEFLMARIAEDVEGATPGEGWNVSGWDHDVPVQFWDYGEVHVGHRRFLAECEAKRRIVELHRRDEGRDWCMEGCGMRSGWVGYPCDTLKALALPFADHPDYREEWRVS